jgi:hypothetical protein
MSMDLKKKIILIKNVMRTKVMSPYLWKYFLNEICPQFVILKLDFTYSTFCYIFKHQPLKRIEFLSFSQCCCWASQHNVKTHSKIRRVNKAWHNQTVWKLRTIIRILKRWGFFVKQLSTVTVLSLTLVLQPQTYTWQCINAKNISNFSEQHVTVRTYVI